MHLLDPKDGMNHRDLSVAFSQPLMTDRSGSGNSNTPNLVAATGLFYIILQSRHSILESHSRCFFYALDRHSMSN